jgi:hypothetical protein
MTRRVLVSPLAERVNLNHQARICCPNCPGSLDGHQRRPSDDRSPGLGKCPIRHVPALRLRACVRNRRSLVGWVESSRPTRPPVVGLEDSTHPATAASHPDPSVPENFVDTLMTLDSARSSPYTHSHTKPDTSRFAVPLLEASEAYDVATSLVACRVSVFCLPSAAPTDWRETR